MMDDVFMLAWRCVALHFIWPYVSFGRVLFRPGVGSSVLYAFPLLEWYGILSGRDDKIGAIDMMG